MVVGWWTGLRRVAGYAAMLAAAAALLALVLPLGERLDPPSGPESGAAAVWAAEGRPEPRPGGGEDLVARTLVAVAGVIVVARLFGWLFTRLRQPRVVGEIVAGIALGPSLLGAVAPEDLVTEAEADAGHVSEGLHVGSALPQRRRERGEHLGGRHLALVADRDVHVGVGGEVGLDVERVRGCVGPAVHGHAGGAGRLEPLRRVKQPVVRPDVVGEQPHGRLGREPRRRPGGRHPVGDQFVVVLEPPAVGTVGVGHDHAEGQGRRPRAALHGQHRDAALRTGPVLPPLGQHALGRVAESDRQVHRGAPYPGVTVGHALGQAIDGLHQANGDQRHQLVVERRPAERTVPQRAA